MLTWENVTIAQALCNASQVYEDNVAIASKGKKITYSQLYQNCRTLATRLRKLGIRKGDHVGTIFGNAPEWIFTKYALHIIGAVIVPINTNFRAEEIKYILRQGDIQTLIMTDQLKSDNFIEMLTEIDPDITVSNNRSINSKEVPCLKRIISFSPRERKYPCAYDFIQIQASEHKCNEKEIDEMIACGAPNDICNILFTSGSTAFPKGVMLNHTSLLGIGRHLLPETFRMEPGSRLLCNSPFYHIAGCVYFPLGALTGGYELHINEFVASEVLEIIDTEKINFFFGFEAHFNTLANAPEFENYDLKSVEHILLAAGPEWYDKCKKIFPGARVIAHHYGFSEGTGVSMMYDEADPEIRKYTNGKPWPGIEVKVVDPVTGAEVDEDINGELCLRGWSRFQGYYKNDEESKKAIDDNGFFHSGDYGSKDRNGNISYRGRYKMMIKTGGENVSEKEVEIFLESMPNIRNVQVFGIPHEKWGEAVTAIIETEPKHDFTQEDVIAFCKGKISRYKIPKNVLFFNGDDWPLLGSGKINKIALRKKVVDKLQ